MPPEQLAQQCPADHMCHRCGFRFLAACAHRVRVRLSAHHRMIYITGRIQTGCFRHTAPVLLSFRLAKYLIAGCAAHGIPRNRQTVWIVGCCCPHNRCSKYSDRCRCHFLAGSSQFYRPVCLCIRAKHIRVFRLHDRCFVDVASFFCFFDNVQQLPCILISTINAITARIQHSVPCQLHSAGLQWRLPAPVPAPVSVHPAEQCSPVPVLSHTQAQNHTGRTETVRCTPSMFSLFSSQFLPSVSSSITRSPALGNPKSPSPDIQKDIRRGG